MSVNKPSYFFILYIFFIILAYQISQMPSNIAIEYFLLALPFIGGYFSKDEKIGGTSSFIGYSSIYVLIIPIFLESIRIAYLDVTFFASLRYWFIGPLSFYLGNLAKNYKVFLILYPVILLALDLAKIGFLPFSSIIWLTFGALFNGFIVISWIWRKQLVVSIF